MLEIGISGVSSSRAALTSWAGLRRRLCVRGCGIVHGDGLVGLADFLLDVQAGYGVIAAVEAG